jgi:hypothetical protein
MTSDIQEQKKQRLDILDGISKGLGNSKIAARLGIPLWTVKRTLRRMRYNGDSELKQAYVRAQELVKKQSAASLSDERFHSVTGMTFKEKTFSNMMSFYRPELMKIIRSKDECAEIRDLSKSVRRTLKHNGIIAHFRVPYITAQARSYLTRTPSMNS